MVYSIKPSASISRIRSFSFPDTDLWPSAAANSDFDREPMSNSLMTLLKIDSGLNSGPEETTAGSRPRVFDVFSPNSGTLMILRKTSPFNELRICPTVRFAIFHKVAHTRTQFVGTVYLPEKGTDQGHPYPPRGDYPCLSEHIDGTFQSIPGENLRPESRVYLVFAERRLFTLVEMRHQCGVIGNIQITIFIAIINAPIAAMHL
jgi:hypothetical protein